MAPNEATRRTRFILFVNTEIRIGLIDTEKSVKVVKDNKANPERIDLSYGLLIMEFKTSLSDKKREDAKTQLRRYVSGLLNEEKRNYTLVATDGIRFEIYRYYITTDASPIKPDDIKLGLKTTIDVKQRMVDADVLSDELVISSIREFIQQTEPPRVLAKTAPLLFQPDNALYVRCIETLKGVDRTVYEVPFNEWKKYQDVVYGDFRRVPGDVQRNMFLNHTYMATVAKIIAHTLTMPDGSPDIDDIILGTAFAKAGIGNFVEDDFFSWVLHQDSREIIDDIRRTAGLIDRDSVDFDMLRSIYETIEEPESRHELGASYTPDWLAEKTLVNLLRRSKMDAPRILDPTCGSGTFLVVAIRLLRRNMQDVDADKTIRAIQTCVFGVDIHPVAVLFSRANYLMAIRDLLPKRKIDIHIPVYMADMVDYPVAIESPLGGKFYTFESGELEMHLPLDIGKSIDYIVDEIHAAAKRLAAGYERDAVLSGLHTKLKRRDIVNPVLSYFDTAATTLGTLISQDRDSIHAFIFKNIYRPATFELFDIICGNPPWVVYKSIKDQKRADRLKTEVVKKLKLQTNPKLFPNMDIATLFYVKCARDMLKPDGHIGFVMPWSILNGKQHDVFRAKRFNGLDLRFVELYDMGEGKNRVKNLFTVESCVLFSKKTKSNAASIPAVRLSGSLPGKNVGLDEAESLKHKKSRIYMRDTPGGNVLTYDRLVVMGESPYKADFFQGATLVPTAAWFVRERSDGLGTGSGKTAVETDDSMTHDANWSMRFSGDIETEYIFHTLKSKSMIPFGYLGMKTVVLPVTMKETDGETKYNVCRDSTTFVAKGHDGMEAYFKQVQSVWKNNKTAKSHDNVADRINRNKGISAQKPDANTIVLYNRAGRSYMVSCMVTSDKFIVDNSTYAYYAASEEEAKYLCSVLNSRHLFKKIKAVKTARDIHRTVFDVPIPRFDATNPDHQKLVKLYDKCHAVICDNHDAISAHGGNREFCFGLLESKMAVIDATVRRLLAAG